MPYINLALPSAEYSDVAGCLEWLAFINLVLSSGLVGSVCETEYSYMPTVGFTVEFKYIGGRPFWRHAITAMCTKSNNNYVASEGIDTDQSVALIVAKVTTDNDRWQVCNENVY